MITNHDRSSALHTWSVICVVVAIISLLLGLYCLAFDEPFTTLFLGGGIGLLIFAPILNGLAVLVEDAEVRLIEQAKEKLRLKKEKELASRPAE